MLLAVVLAVAPTEPVPVPAVLGRAVHAWLLKRVAGVDAALAQGLHERDEVRPFTCSDLVGGGRAQDGLVTLTPERGAWLRVTALSADMAQAVEVALPRPGEPLGLLEGVPLQVQAVYTDGEAHPWAGRSSYAELLQGHTLTPGPRPWGATLEFASATLFRSEGQDVPLPVPSRVFGSYLARWNTFSPVTLPEEARRYAEECVTLGRYRLRSRLVSFERGAKGAHVGFVGRVGFRFRVGDPYWTRILSLLAAYSFWCGTGYRTTAGLGQTRMVERTT